MELTTNEVAEKLGISVRQIQTLIAKGTIPATKRGRDWFIDEDVLEWESVKNRPITGRPKKNK